MNSQKQHQGTRTEHATNVVAHEAKEEDIAALAS
jgi:cytochrome c553